MIAAPTFPLHTHIGLDLAGVFLARTWNPRIAIAPTVADAAGLLDWLDGSARAIALSDLNDADAGSARAALVLVSAYADIGPTLDRLRLASVAIVAPGQFAGILRARASALASHRAVQTIGRNPRVREVHGIGQPSSVAWALLARIAARGNRPDLADRLEVRYRHSLTPSRDVWLARTVAILANPT
ncbi:MAG: hypothetical protein EPO26_01715 [Chloroflexota bacterium]|nr:MAG: hypothetical protein EPO26_01715 [Chloroflexota bacterium]